MKPKRKRAYHRALKREEPWSRLHYMVENYEQWVLGVARETLNMIYGTEKTND